MGTDDNWIKMCMEIESRSIQSAQLEVQNAKTLYRQLLKILNDGYQQSGQFLVATIECGFQASESR